MDKKLEYTSLEVVEELRKSLYKMAKKAFKNTSGNKKKYKVDAQKVVDDILDPNYIAQVKPDDIPQAKDGVLWKGKDKGIEKLKKFKSKK